METNQHVLSKALQSRMGRNTLSHSHSPHSITQNFSGRSLTSRSRGEIKQEFGLMASTETIDEEEVHRFRSMSLEFRDSTPCEVASPTSERPIKLIQHVSITDNVPSIPVKSTLSRPGSFNINLHTMTAERRRFFARTISRSIDIDDHDATSWDNPHKLLFRRR